MNKFSLIYNDVKESIADVEIFWTSPLELDLKVVYKSMPLVNYSIDILSKSEYLCNVFKKQIDILDSLDKYLWGVFKKENPCYSYYNKNHEMIFIQYVKNILMDIQKQLPELKIVENS